MTHDSGRGVWPLKSGWLWVTANGYTSNKDAIGLNFGDLRSEYQNTHFTEDAFFVNGKMFKLNSVSMSVVNENDVKFISEPNTEIKSHCNVVFF